MAHAGTTRDLGLTRPTTNEKRPGWFRAPLMVAAAIALGLAVGTAAWTLAGSQSVSVANSNGGRRRHPREDRGASGPRRRQCRSRV